MAVYWCNSTEFQVISAVTQDSGRGFGQAYPTVCNRNGGIPRHLPPLLELRLCARVLVRMHVYIDGLNVWNKIFNLI